MGHLGCTCATGTTMMCSPRGPDLCVISFGDIRTRAEVPGDPFCSGDEKTSFTACFPGLICSSLTVSVEPSDICIATTRSAPCLGSCGPPGDQGPGRPGVLTKASVCLLGSACGPWTGGGIAGLWACG